MTRLRVALALTAVLAAGACASDDDREDLGVETYLHNAQGYVDGGHFEQALIMFRRALEVAPENHKAMLGETSVLYWLGAKEAPGAGGAILEAAEKADRLDPEAYGENAWKVHLTQGMIHARLSELWGRKADAARKAAGGEESGDDPGALEAESNREAEADRATVSFKAVLAAEDQPLARNNLSALFYLARQGCLRAKTPEDYAEPIGYLRRYEEEVGKSKKLWTEMMKREPDLAEVYKFKLKSAESQEIELRDLVANILFKQHRHEQSIEELDKVIALDPYRAAAFFNRGRNHEELGKFGAAADDYRRFLMLTELPPGSPQVVEAAERKEKCEKALLESLGR
jgi:tetratricopeptide (TPR) repeat protein